MTKEALGNARMWREYSNRNKLQWMRTRIEGNSGSAGSAG